MVFTKVSVCPASEQTITLGRINELPSKSESVKFPLFKSVIGLFTDSEVKKYFLPSFKLIFKVSSVEKIFFTFKSVNFH